MEWIKSSGVSIGVGSILAISDEEGNSVEQRHYDAWGNMTHLQIGSGAVLTGDELERAKAQMFLDRGYTSHEHFWEVGIIHMCRAVPP